MDAMKSADRNKSKRDFRYAESQLRNLNTKIDNLLNKLEEKKQDEAKTPEEECVICVNSKATMQTWPCGHRVVCRKCLVRTIQIAVSRRALPLRCVVCRARVLRLKRSSDHQTYLRHDKGRSHSLPVKLRRRTSAPTLAVRSRSVGPSKSSRLPATVDRRPFNYIRAQTGICVDWIDEPTLLAKYKKIENDISHERISNDKSKTGIKKVLGKFKFWKFFRFKTINA